jgi:DNA-binding NtrC family response regulator
VCALAGRAMPKEINILVLEEDPGSQNAIQMMMDGEGWKVKLLGDADAGMQELAHGSWALVVASVAMTGYSSPLFQILKELAQAPPVEEGKSRVRVLFVVAAGEVTEALPVMEKARLPYAMKPYHFNDFMEKVNDLLLQAQFVTKTARERGFAFEQRESAAKSKKGKSAAASNSMFASRDEYYYTEEELAEYEKELKEEEKKKKKKLTDRPI